MSKLHKTNTIDVAQRVAVLIDQAVNEATKGVTKWKRQYKTVMDELELEISQSEIEIKDLTEDNLSINRIEEEGYLRALKTMVNRFKNWEKM